MYGYPSEFPNFLVSNQFIVNSFFPYPRMAVGTSLVTDRNRPLNESTCFIAVPMIVSCLFYRIYLSMAISVTLVVLAKGGKYQTLKTSK